MKIALAQTNFFLGAFRENRERIFSFINKAKRAQCDLVLFPESTLFGYPPKDLVSRNSIIKEQLKEFSKLSSQMPESIAALVGLFTENTDCKVKPVRNSMALLQKGKPTQFFHKTLLPNYNVFEDFRHTEPSENPEDNFFSLCGFRFQVLICEDLWSWSSDFYKKHSPLLKLAHKKKDAVLCLNASPFLEHKDAVRKDVAQKAIDALKVPLFYVNSIGLQDEVIFDGRSFVMDAQKNIIHQSKSFEEDFSVVEFPLSQTPCKNKKEEPLLMLRKALILGIKDFVQKSGFSKVHLGLSGGVDSALVACLAKEALGSDKVHCLFLPSQFSRKESLTLARSLSQNLNTHWYEISIEKIYDSIIHSLETIFSDFEFGITHENVQARIRGLLLMAFANKNQSLLLGTSNKDELSVGYTTSYGDACGALAPIGDVLKPTVYQLAETFYSDVIPKAIFQRPPSAELRPHQTDQDTLPPYKELSPMIHNMIEKRKPAHTTQEAHWLKAIFQSEFKRRQAPPVLKVSQHTFGSSFKLPIQHKAWF